MTGSDELMIFSSKPKAFKMDRRSRAACTLKAAVLRKLVEFLDNYTDDDLAEYIVVLVCNGKHQNQARDDLEAFLGNSSGRFVLWLWSHLSRELCEPESLALVQPLVNADDSTICHTSNDVHETKGAREREFDTHHLLSSGDQRLPIIKFNPKPPAAGSFSEALQSPYSGSSAPFIDVNCKGGQQQTLQILRSVAMTDELRTTTKISHSSDKSFSETSCYSDKAGLQFEDRYQKVAVSETSAAAPQHSLFSLNRASRDERSMITGRKLQGLSSIGTIGMPSTQAMDSQNSRPRISVWDRLGKPHEVHDDANIQNFVTSATVRKRVCHGQNRSEHKPITEEDGIKQKGGDSAGMTRVNEHPAKIMLVHHTHEHQDAVHTAESFKRRRQFKVKGVDDSTLLSSSKAKASQILSIQETCKKIQQSAPVNSDASPGSLELQPIPKNAGHDSKSTKLLSKPSENSEASTATPNTQLSQSSLLTAKLFCSGYVATDSNDFPMKNVEKHLLPSVKLIMFYFPFLILLCVSMAMQMFLQDVSDFDSQLYKVKKAILELHTKQAEISKDAKRVFLGSSTQGHGAQNQNAEDAEGRTLFVANVHFAAPKEALHSHFSKFGPVVKVTLLMDSMTGMPKGCAYIVFHYKGSAEKALSLNGTSFFSRTLKVMWKVEMPQDILGPGQSGAKSLKYSRTQGIGSLNFRKQYYAPHLKWIREDQEIEKNLGRSEASIKQA